MSDWLQLHGYADGELDGNERSDVEQMIAGCKRTQRELEAIRTVKQIAASRRDRISCEATWARCRRRLAEMDRAGHVESVVGKYAWALCGAFLLFIFGAAMMNRLGSGAVVGASDVPRLAAGLSPYLFAPRSQSPQDVGDFERRALGSAPVRITPTAGQPQIVLLRGGQAIINGRHQVRIDMLDKGSPVTLYALQGADIGGVEPLAGTEDMYYGALNNRNLVGWKEGDYTVLLVGDQSISELRSLARVVGGK